MTLAVIGGGAMGEAIVAAVLRAKVYAPEDVRVAELVEGRRQQLASAYGISTFESPAEAAVGTEFVLLAVKPQDFEAAATALDSLVAGATGISIVAGVPLARLTEALQTGWVVRAMPNTPAQIGEGMTVWTATASMPADAREGPRRIFAAMGKEAFVPDEKYLDMATALSGSGPAYVFLFIEALIDAGVHVGLSRELATASALQTVIGAARYAEKTSRHPAELRAQVTSPGGTTAAALRVLESGAFRSDVLEAVVAAFERAKALGEGEKK
jgi:pyrroline-5-carboxylate reductase